MGRYTRSPENPMKAGLLALGILGWTAQALVAVPRIQLSTPNVPPGKTAGKQPPLLGEATAPAILANRARFRENLAKVKLTSGLKARWKAVRQPFTLVAVFGSWCGDSYRQLPDLLALDSDPNPFIEVHC